MQTITRKGNFDSAHRIVNHGGKCANMHGHTYNYELTISFDSMEAFNNKEDIGYPIDFADLKSLAIGYIDAHYDHALIYNPKDPQLIPTIKINPQWKLVDMWLKDGEYCNPSVENIALQLFVELNALFITNKCPFVIHSLRVYETPNSYTDMDWKVDNLLINILTKKAFSLKRVQEWK